MMAGKRDRRIVLERNEATEDGAGQPVDNWVPLGNPIWASKQNISDGERLRAAEVGTVSTVRFRVLWSGIVASLTTKDRVIFDGVPHDITALKELGRREGCEITAAARLDLVR